MTISFLIPAHDEERDLAATLAAIDTAVGARAHEVVVVADACSDDTVAIARAAGARVVEVDVRQIAAARNAGAAVATGELFVFVDADTRVTPALLAAVERAVADGALGGGALVRFDRPWPRWAHVLLPLLTSLYFAFGLAAGCFVFVRRDVFAAVGGFDGALFAGEEVAFSRAVKRLARRRRRQGDRLAHFCVLRERVETSARKLRTHSGWSLLWLSVRLLLGGRRGVRSRRRLDLWYGPRVRDPGGG